MCKSILLSNILGPIHILDYKNMGERGKERERNYFPIRTGEWIENISLPWAG